MVAAVANIGRLTSVIEGISGEGEVRFIPCCQIGIRVCTYVPKGLVSYTSSRTMKILYALM